MKVTRLDLDGTGSPAGLVTKILKAEPNLPIPVPIEDLAHQLEIGEIGELSTEGFEGGLLTDDVRSFGGILIRKGMDTRRRRFTIGHELGHFLLPFHKPAKPGNFLCSRADMSRWTANEQDRAAKMEVEANQFSALILMPPPHLRAFLSKLGRPSLESVFNVHEQYLVSKEAAARAYVQYHTETIAIAVVRDGRVQRIYRGRTFPKLCIEHGDAVPRSTRLQGSPGTLSDMQEGQAAHWLQSDFGVALPALYQQTIVQANGFAMVLLWPEVVEVEHETDQDDHRTSRQRYQNRMDKRR